jgi:hypothetical protein
LLADAADYALEPRVEIHPDVTPAQEAVSKSAIWLDRHRASFETAALRPPQDEDFLNANKDLPHAEERPQGVSRSTHYLTTAGLANLLTA